MRSHDDKIDVRLLNHLEDLFTRIAVIDHRLDARITIFRTLRERMEFFPADTRQIFDRPKERIPIGGSRKKKQTWSKAAPLKMRRRQTLLLG